MDYKVLFGIQDREGQPKVTGMNKLAHTSFNVDQKQGTIESKRLDGGRFKADAYPGRKSVEGDLSTEPNINEIEAILQGSGFVKQGDTYKHKDIEATNKFFTLIKDYGSKNFYMVYEDCVVNNLTLSVQQEAYVELKADVIGKQRKINKSKYRGSAELYPGNRLICYGAQIVQDETDISADVEGVDITISNSVEGKGGVNSRFNTKIEKNGKGTLTASLNLNTFDLDDYISSIEKMDSNKPMKVILTLKEDVENEVAKKGKVLEVIMPNVKIGELSPNEDSGTLAKTLNIFPDENGDAIMFKVTDKGAGA